ncbi:helix-turn-helix transcriptional regulator [Rhodanobacter sp. DHB23]|uniref:helix-turn-helix domain-containing protein n=1 Tax=Rhodanobacter sp. DHB23 TaxID=2775923 RepID=UPI00177B34E0|nr:helix-turn-helix transcriptional regulator [Rhodanobacter sp. DHB23]MBD8871314.1 helix-turn-helix transcriptional regulator [Rhodanobacter sp. DHB23]
MSASAILVQAIRGELRHRGMTYRELAARLGVSEPTIKRDLSRGGFSLQRLDGICELLGLSLEDLIRNERSAPAAVTELSRKQESALVADPKLLLTTYLILNNWRFDEIRATFRVDENELVSLLLKLDALEIIDYRPPTRIRKLTARNFSWRKDGPVHRYFVARVLPEFFDESFGGASDAFHFVGATLSEGSRLRLQASMARLIEEFEQLARADARLPLSARDGCGALIAFRRWEFSEFTHLRRRRASPD